MPPKRRRSWMIKADLAIVGIAELATPEGREARSGAHLNKLRIVEDAAVALMLAGDLGTVTPRHDVHTSLHIGRDHAPVHRGRAACDLAWLDGPSVALLIRVVRAGAPVGRGGTRGDPVDAGAQIGGLFRPPRAGSSGFPGR